MEKAFKEYAQAQQAYVPSINDRSSEPTIVSISNFAESLASRMRDAEAHAERIVSRLIGGYPEKNGEGSTGPVTPRPVDPHVTTIHEALNAMERRLSGLNSHLNRLSDTVGVDRA